MICSGLAKEQVKSTETQTIEVVLCWRYDIGRHPAIDDQTNFPI